MREIKNCTRKHNLASLQNERNLSFWRCFLPLDHKVPKNAFAEIIISNGVHTPRANHLMCHNGNFSWERTVAQGAWQNVLMRKNVILLLDIHIYILTMLIHRTTTTISPSVCTLKYLVAPLVSGSIFCKKKV